jgi:hypothetical protein
MSAVQCAGIGLLAGLMFVAGYVVGKAFVKEYLNRRRP